MTRISFTDMTLRTQITNRNFEVSPAIFFGMPTSGNFCYLDGLSVMVNRLFNALPLPGSDSLSTRLVSGKPHLKPGISQVFFPQI